MAVRKNQAKPAPEATHEAPVEPHLIGYARVSTADQNPQMQIDALLKAGVQPNDIYVEQASGGASSKRPELAAALKDAREGDIVVVWKLDRLGRSVRQVLATFEHLDGRGVKIRSITQPGMDTTTAVGRLIVTIMTAVAEMERDLSNERTAAGLKSARAQGRIGGRKKTRTDEQIIEAAKLGTAAGARSLKISLAQFKRRMRQLGVSNAD